MSALAYELSLVRERLQDLGWDLCPLHEKGDPEAAKEIREIMPALIEQEKALARLVEWLAKAELCTFCTEGRR